MAVHCRRSAGLAAFGAAEDLHDGRALVRRCDLRRCTYGVPLAVAELTTPPSPPGAPCHRDAMYVAAGPHLYISAPQRSERGGTFARASASGPRGPFVLRTSVALDFAPYARELGRGGSPGPHRDRAPRSSRFAPTRWGPLSSTSGFPCVSAAVPHHPIQAEFEQPSCRCQTPPVERSFAEHISYTRRIDVTTSGEQRSERSCPWLR